MDTPTQAGWNVWKRTGAARPDPEGDATEVVDPGVDRTHVRPASLETLFRESYRSIVQSLTIACGDQAAAEDATQEAFAQAWVRWDRISRYDNPGAWVRRAAINKLRNAHRSRLRGEAAVQRMPADHAYPPPGEPESDLIRGLQRLPYKQRMCAVLFYVDDLSTAEVAQAMGISQGSVSQHLNRARTALRVHMEGRP